jgi:hypothetical protein
LSDTELVVIIAGVLRPPDFLDCADQDDPAATYSVPNVGTGDCSSPI